MAFSFFISLIPFLLILMAVTTYLPLGDFRAMIESSLESLMPEEASAYLMQIVDDIFREINVGKKGGLLSLGFILALWFASNGIVDMIRGFGKSYDHVFKSRGFLKKRLVAIEITAIIGFLLLIASFLLFSGRFAFEWLEQSLEFPKGGIWFLLFLKWILLIGLVYTIISMIYRLGPPMKEKISYFSPGTTMATIFCLLTSFAFSYFVNNFGNYNKIYGSLAALIILLLWMQINCFIVLVGFELNASIAVQKGGYVIERKSGNQKYKEGL